jgi:hypothetical protein
MTDKADVTLWLRDVSELFVERDFDPFAEHGIERPGLELVANYVEARGLLRNLQVEVYVPAEQCGPEMHRRMDAAIDRYAARRVAWSRNKIQSSRNYGLRVLAYAVVVVLLALGLYTAVLRIGNEVASSIAQSLFIITTWIAVWDSVENLVFDVLDETRMVGVWKKVGDLDLTLRPHPDAADH